MADKPVPVRPKKLEHGKDSAGHEFAGDVGLTERIGPPRPTPAPVPSPGNRPRPVPRAPHPAPAAPPPPAPSPARAPDPSIAGSKYFTSSNEGKPAAPRQMSSVRREGDTDSDAFDTTLEDDLGDVTRRRERERAAHSPPEEEEHRGPAGTGSSQGRKDLDAEARPRELDFSAPDMPRKRRSMGPM